MSPRDDEALGRDGFTAEELRVFEELSGKANRADEPDADYIEPYWDDKLDRWRRELEQTPKLKKRDVFERAAEALFLEAQSECNLKTVQAVADCVYELGKYDAGLGDDDVEFIIIGAKAKAERPIVNGHSDDDTDFGPAEPPVDFGDTTEPTTKQPKGKQTAAPAVFVTPGQWPNEAPPPVEWLVLNRFPRGEVSGLIGDGGAGKTDGAVRLAANVARSAPDWFGHEIIGVGPVVFISAEEPEREIRRRLWLHSQRDGYELDELPELRLWFPDEQAPDTVLATPDRSSVMRPTPLFRSIEAAIKQVQPVGVIVDNVAATFGGQQNDRGMARSYVNLWRTVARIESRPAVILIDHPSLAGLQNGTGRGGNMDWWNALRCVNYLYPSDDKAEADRGIRILETKKSNYGPSGKLTQLRLLWSDGRLEREQTPSSLHRLAKDAECEETFLRLLDERNAQGRHVGDKNSKNYAPSIFAETAGNGGFTSKAFAQAMERLFKNRTIALRQVKRDGKIRDIIDRASAADEALTQ
jgi:RecA-family ATPase